MSENQIIKKPLKTFSFASNIAKKFNLLASIENEQNVKQNECNDTSNIFKLNKNKRKINEIYEGDENQFLLVNDDKKVKIENISSKNLKTTIDKEATTKRYKIGTLISNYDY